MKDLWELDAPSDEKKLEDVYHLYRDTMLYVARGILSDPHLAEDAVQEAFIRIAANLRKISEVKSPQTKVFAAVITRNVALTILNDLNKQIFVDNIDPLAFAESDHSDSILNQLEYKEVLSAIHKLSPTLREAFEMYYIQGFKVTEISRKLEISQETVKKRIQRGKHKLMEILSWDERSVKK